MNDIAVKIASVSKCYQLGELAPYRTLRETINRAVTAPVRWLHQEKKNSNDSASAKKNELWALDNVSFEVKKGEVLGIIGRNGAGKSTLLKIISRITEPSQGQIDIYGRVASLLEVGTGFHPELTGRENVYLNGSILGMNRAEINRKFKEIVDFSGVEKFLDTPVKRYSSGMTVRLAFAVAAHLEPEILIIDEVLAVGDAEFQRRCLGKMGDIASTGRTVLFVSHNLDAVASLCTRTLWLDQGKITGDGENYVVIRQYLESSSGVKGATYKSASRALNGPVGLLGARVLKVNAAATEKVNCSNGDELLLEIVLAIHQPDGYAISISVEREGQLAFVANSFHAEKIFDFSTSGNYIVRFSFPKYLLNPGFHEFGIIVTRKVKTRIMLLKEPRILSLELTDDGLRRNNLYTGDWPGAVSPILDIDINKQEIMPEWAEIGHSTH